MAKKSKQSDAQIYGILFLVSLAVHFGTGGTGLSITADFWGHVGKFVGIYVVLLILLAVYNSFIKKK